MTPERFEKITVYAQKTGIGEHYLWGAEWWYHKEQEGNSWYWNQAKYLLEEDTLLK